jgi:arylformamidase
MTQFADEPDPLQPRPRLAGQPVQQPRPGARPCAPFERWANASRGARSKPSAHAGPALRPRPAKRWMCFRPAPAGARSAPVLVFIHGGYWRSLDKADHSFCRTGLLCARACAWWCPTTRCARRSPCPTSPCRWCRRWPGCTATLPRTAATRAASRWWGIRRAGTWRPCCWPASGRGGADLPEAGETTRCRSRVCTTCRPCGTRRSAADLRLTPHQVAEGQPGAAAAPAVREGALGLVAVAGGDESSEFLRQNRLIRRPGAPERGAGVRRPARPEPLQRAGSAGRSPGPPAASPGCPLL